jgi:membrane-associated protease RseP (regulator of RpoE activity)
MFSLIPFSNHVRKCSVQLLLSLPLALLLTSCAMPPLTGTGAESATQREALRRLVSQQERLYEVAGPLMVNNAELCRDNARNLLGFTAKNRYSYSEELTNAAESLLGLGEPLEVVGVLAGGGAAKAGLREGDRLVSVEGQSIPSGPNAEREAAALLAPMARDRNGVSLTVSRNGSPVTLAVPLTYACAFSIEVGNSDNVNAYSDGRNIMITRGLIDVANSDDELAYVLAKELAHSTLKHSHRLRMNGAMSAVISNLRRVNPDPNAIREAYSRIRPYPADLDAAADSLALYMLARAGYDIDDAAGFWKDLAAEYPQSASAHYTALHPSTEQRLAAINKTAAEIRNKKAARKPLLP